MRSWTITSVWGIPIRISVSLVLFLPVLAWLIGSGQQISVYAGVVSGFTGTPLDVATLRAGSTPWLIGVLAAVGLFVSVAIHELGHAWMAMRYGLAVESITLWILGGLARLGEMPREWNREFWIAIVGPITSVAVGAGFWVAANVLPASQPVAVFVVGWLAVTNVVLAVFNLVPAFPMDGGRVLRALLARSRPYADATRIAARVGSAFALLFVVVGVLSFSPILVLLAVFLWGAANGESRTVALEALLDGYRVRDVVGDVDRIHADESVSTLVERMVRDRRQTFAVEEGGEVVGAVTPTDVRDVPADERDARTVGSIATTPGVRVRADDGAFEALSALSGSGDVALVLDGETPVGVVTVEDFGSFTGYLQTWTASSGRGRRGPAMR